MTTETAGRSPLTLVRWVLWGLAAAAAIAFAFLWLRTPSDAGRSQPGSPSFTIGGPFTLTDGNGQPFSSQKLSGRPYVMFFGFTNCPDVCPNTLGRLASLRKQLGKGDDAFRIVFVSVDPQRDKPQVVKDYVGLFGTPIIGLTGDQAQIDRVAKNHAIYQKKVADASAPDGYTVDHGAAALLFDREGKFVATIAQEEGPDPALAKLRRLTS